MISLPSDVLYIETVEDNLTGQHLLLQHSEKVPKYLKCGEYSVQKLLMNLEINNTLMLYTLIYSIGKHSNIILLSNCMIQHLFM